MRPSQLRSRRAVLVDLSHAITDGMTTSPGPPGPPICDLAGRPALVVGVARQPTRSLGPETFDWLDVDGRVVLLRTRQDALVGADDHGANRHPFLSRAGAESVRDRGVGTSPVRADAEIDGP